MVMPEALVWIPVYGFVAILLGMGTAAYRGKWRRWAIRPPKHFEFGKRSYFGFFVFYAGITVAVMATWALIGWLGVRESLDGFFFVSVGLSGILTLSALTVFPRFLQPAWYRRWLDNGEVAADLHIQGTGNPVLDWISKREAQKKLQNNGGKK